MTILALIYHRKFNASNFKILLTLKLTKLRLLVLDVFNIHYNINIF